MPAPFVHLHVASGYSLRYGASPPHVLVQRAAEHDMDTLALTDRDGTYGAVKFARACFGVGLRPVLGVELAHHSTLPPGALGGAPTAGARTPVRGGALRDPGLGGAPRVTILASADGAGGGRAGWAALCRLVSATHLAGERGRPVLDPTGSVRDDADLLERLAAGHLMVLLGPTSEVARAVARRRDDLARAALEPWLDLLPRTHVQIEVVSHRLPATAAGDRGNRWGDPWGPGTTPHAGRMLRLAREAGLGAVLSNAVRYADRQDATTADVLDAARRLVALDRRHVDRGNAEGFMKSGKEMAEVAEEVARAAGATDPARAAMALIGHTRSVADRCALDPRADLGVGEVHFPELDLAPGGATPRFTPGATRADALLRARCEASIGDRYGSGPMVVVWTRLDDELETIRQLGYASYFLTVGDVTDLIREMGVRCAARGSGAGSLVNYLLGVSGVDPVQHRLLMERFLSPLRDALPDIDVDVESARRAEVYERILDRYGGERCVCVSMMDTYRVRHAVRDVGAALGMPPAETDAIAKAFPHIRARDARSALRELPELRATGLGEERLDLMFGLVERLDGLPRHIAVHPCGVLLSDATLLDRTPVEASFAGFPMSQFDKDDVEDLGLLKLDVLGIRMQSSMAHAVAEISRTDGVELDLDDPAQVPLDDPETYRLISSARTLGIFQLESPGQRELVGRSGIDTFEEIITDISLFRPGPVKSDMITPYLEGKQGWRAPTYLHDDLRPILGPTQGVVVFHEQVIEMIAQLAGVGFAEADERRRALGDVVGMAVTRRWFVPRALSRGYAPVVVDRVWTVLQAFASFGFCKAHAAAFALPTFQSAWLKAHWPAHFLAGVLTHDPGMYPKRLILDEVRQLGLTVLGVDVNASGSDYAVEQAGDRLGIRVALAEVRGISAAEVGRIVAARPYRSLTDFWHRAQVSRPVAERLVLAGGFDTVYRIATDADGVPRRGRLTRRDLLLQVAELDRFGRLLERAGRARGRPRAAGRGRPGSSARSMAQDAAVRNSVDPLERARAVPLERHPLADAGVWARAATQGRRTATAAPVDSVQLTFDLGDAPGEGEVSGLPEMTAEERTQAELEILGLDVNRHVIDPYAELLDALGVVRTADLLRQRNRADILVAGVKVATQTPPIRSGRRVIFLTLDDSTGPVDATFFEDVQGPCAATCFHSWLLVVRGVLRRTGPRGVSIRATGCWDLTTLDPLWRTGGIEAVREHLAVVSQGFSDPGAGGSGQLAEGVARRLWHRSREVLDDPKLGDMSAGSVSERRANARTAVVWDALGPVLDGASLDVLDVGGGTGGFAVRVAERGHRVVVVDPSPDALAALGRRARERGVEVSGQQGDLTSLAELVGPRSADLVLCHGVLEVVLDPVAALAAIASTLRPGGTVSLLVAGRHAAVVARAMAGHFGEARELLDQPVGRGGHRFTAAEVTSLVESAGLAVESIHGVRVFADLVPGALLDLEPGATAALVELERSVASRAEYLPLATQLHVLATRAG